MTRYVLRGTGDLGVSVLCLCCSRTFRQTRRCIRKLDASLGDAVCVLCVGRVTFDQQVQIRFRGKLSKVREAAQLISYVR